MRRVIVLFAIVGAAVASFVVALFGNAASTGAIDVPRDYRGNGALAFFVLGFVVVLYFAWLSLWRAHRWAHVAADPGRARSYTVAAFLVPVAMIAGAAVSGAFVAFFVLPAALIGGLSALLFRRAPAWLGAAVIVLLVAVTASTRYLLPGVETGPPTGAPPIRATVAGFLSLLGLPMMFGASLAWAVRSTTGSHVALISVLFVLASLVVVFGIPPVRI